MSDLISRQALQKAMYERAFETDGDTMWQSGCWVRYRAIEDVIKSQPSAQPEQRWIPCSERLPENGRQVLVYAMSVHFVLAKYDEMREADGSYKKQWVTFDAWKPYYTVKDVIAWMELPIPYREEGEKSNERKR